MLPSKHISVNKSNSLIDNIPSNDTQQLTSLYTANKPSSLDVNSLGEAANQQHQNTTLNKPQLQNTQIKSSSASTSSSPYFDESSSSSSLFQPNLYSSSANSTASNSPVNTQGSTQALRFINDPATITNSNKQNQRPRSLIVVQKSGPPLPPTLTTQKSESHENQDVNFSDESIIAYSQVI